MKKYFAVFLVFWLLVSCDSSTNNYAYQYNVAPSYQWGYAQFYGAYYRDYGNANNVISVSLFSDSLDVDDNGDLKGYGQYLYLEDVFVEPADTLIPDGTYKVSESGSSFTVNPGKIFKVDNAEYVIGSYIYYVEKKSSFTVRKLISRGSFSVSNSPIETSVKCNFVLSDSSKVTGSFSKPLTHYIYKANTTRNTALLKRK